MNFEFHIRRIVLFLFCLVMLPLAGAETLLAEGVREIEELRMRQLQAAQDGAELSAFTTDGCSGNLSNSWEQLAGAIPKFEDELGNEPPWEHCCVAHDRVYWHGETVDGYRERLTADQALRQCVIDTGTTLAPDLSTRYSRSEAQVAQAFAVVADVMYRAVRLGGQPCSLLPWRWGYGWPNCAFTPMGDAPTDYSDLKTDERIVFFNTTAWLDEDKLHWNVPIHAWIYEPAASVNRRAAFAALLESNYELQLNGENEASFDRRTNLLIADNERGKQLVIRLAGQDVALPESAENGHVKSVVQIPVATVEAISEQGRLRFLALTPPQDERQFEGEVKLIPDRGLGVISDIDDTVKITEVTDRKRLLNNTFYREFREVPGMAELYRQLADQAVSFHFVSSSPWQLYEPLQEFLARAKFPWAALHLKAFRFRDETLLNLFRPGTETKPAQIEPILDKFPRRKFVLIGDSGEQDPEVYGDIARRYPDRIARVLIRNVDDSEPDDARYRLAFDQVPGNKWQLFDSPAQISITRFP